MDKKLLLIIFIVLAAALFLAYWIFIVNPSITSPSNPNGLSLLSTTSQEQANVKHFDYEPGEATVLNGTIESINTLAKVLMVKASDKENSPALKGKTFTVVIAAETQIKRLSGGYSIIKKNNQTEVVSLGLGTSTPTQNQTDSWPVLIFTDFKIGDSVIILNEQGISSQDSFVAKAVYKK